MENGKTYREGKIGCLCDVGIMIIIFSTLKLIYYTSLWCLGGLVLDGGGLWKVTKIVRKIITAVHSVAAQ